MIAQSQIDSLCIYRSLYILYAVIQYMNCSISGWLKLLKALERDSGALG
jgi:hypothetical protein